MASKSKGVGRGGARAGAGRPKGSKSTIYRPHLRRIAAAGPGILPKDLMLAVMRRHYRAKRYDQAVAVAALVAPYVHPRLSCSNITVKPSLREVLVQTSDEELTAFIEESERELAAAPGGKEALAAMRAKGNA
jgi:hypothetical protein